MDSKLIALSAVIALALATAGLASAQPINFFPEQFYGSVMINGHPAPDGVLISAKSGTSNVVAGGGGLTSGGQYGFTNPAFVVQMRDQDTGANVDFYVQGVKAASASFNPGASVELDLSVNMTDFCGDSVCTSGESCSSCPSDCGTCPTPPSGGGGSGGGGGGTQVTSGGGGGGGGGSASCTESWICTDWTECSNSMQQRACADANRCNTTVSKPAESQSCVMSQVCQPGQAECQGSNLMVCSSSGTTWILSQSCGSGCSNGACNPSTTGSPTEQGAGTGAGGSSPITGSFLLDQSSWPIWAAVAVAIAALAGLVLFSRRR